MADNHEKSESLNIKDLRLWDENPRYSEKSKILINDIGSDDFKIEEGFIIQDQYEDNYFKYQKRLLNNFDSIKTTYDLLESIANIGFDTALDDVFVIKPINTISKISKDNLEQKYIKSIYYVVEGNRRLMCLDLLKNYHNSRVGIINLINELDTRGTDDKYAKEKIKCLKAILSICSDYDASPTVSSFISCKVMDFDYYATDEGVQELNKILNSRHFGNRKGKLNWPRGLILKKIFSLIKTSIKINPELSNKNNSAELYKTIENFVGKRISSTDVRAALFVNKAISEWNAKRSPRIDWRDTETGDIDQSVNNTVYDEDGTEIASSEKTVTIFVSSLENSLSNIKILDSNFEKVSLSKILKIEYDLKKLYLDSEDYILGKLFINGTYRELPTEDLNNILIEIVGGVMNGEINTRSSSNNKVSKYAENIRNILFPMDTVPVTKALDLSIDQIISLGQLDDQKNNSEMNSISNDLKTIISLYELNNEELNNKFARDNSEVFKRVIWLIWKQEYGRVFKFKDKTSLKEIPTLVFSLLYRTTFEFIQQMIAINMALEYIKSYKDSDKEYNSLLDKYFNQTINIILKNIFKKNGTNVSDFKETFDKENEANKKLMIEDLERFFYLMMGLEEFVIDEQLLIKFRYFDDVPTDEFENEIFYKTHHNGNVYLKIDDDNGKIDFDDLKVIKKHCLGNNFFGELNDSEQVNAVFEIVNMAYMSINGKNKNVMNMVNRTIHRPLAALFTYEKNDNLKDLKVFIEALKDIESLVMKISKN